MIHTYIDKGTSEDLIMRNQPIPARKGNVSHTGIRRCCAGYNVPVGSRQGVKATPDLPKRRGCPGDPCASGLPEQRAHRPCPGTGGGKLNPREECCTGRSFACLPLQGGFWGMGQTKRMCPVGNMLWVIQSKSLVGCSFFIANF